MKIADATIPGLQEVLQCNPVNPQPGCTNLSPRPAGAPIYTNLADVVSGALNIIFFAAFFITFYFLIWGAIQYIMAQGQKENLAKARARITWAIVGLIVTLLAFAIAKLISEIFRPTIGGLPF